MGLNMSHMFYGDDIFFVGELLADNIANMVDGSGVKLDFIWFLVLK